MGAVNAAPGRPERVPAHAAEIAQQRAAAWLTRRGVAAGQRIAVTGEPSARYLALIGGAVRSGIVPVPIAADLPDDDRRWLVADAAPALTIDEAAYRAIAATEPGELGALPLTKPMLYTSGTTGRRKGVYVAPWDHETAAAAFHDEQSMWRFSPDDTHLVCSALYHSAPLRFALFTLWCGGDVLLMPRFDPVAAEEALHEHGVTTTFMAPTHAQRILAHATSERVGLRLLAHAGAPCPPDVKRAWHRRAGAAHVWEFYGSTEAQFTACSGAEWEDRPGTVGRARPGRELRIDARGQVWCRQPPDGRFEYWNDPAKTAAAWSADWCTVGDLGHLDDDGYLFLDGRRDDLIVSGGVNVYPLEVERILGQCQELGEYAVFGADDRDWGQTVCLAYTGPASEQAIAAYARVHLPPASRPKHYRRVDALPHGVTGKLSRTRLRDDMQHDTTERRRDGGPT